MAVEDATITLTINKLYPNNKYTNDMSKLTIQT